MAAGVKKAELDRDGIRAARAEMRRCMAAYHAFAGAERALQVLEQAEDALKGFREQERQAKAAAESAQRLLDATRAELAELQTSVTLAKSALAMQREQIQREAEQAQERLEAVRRESDALVAGMLERA